MAYFARIDENNIVNLIIVVDDENVKDSYGNIDENIGNFYCKNLVNDINSNWKMTSNDYLSDYRARPAKVGFLYDETLDIFIPQKPYPSWILSETLKNWVPPVEYDGQLFVSGCVNNPPPSSSYATWDEKNLSWKEISI